MGLQVSKAARAYLNRRRRPEDPERTVTFSIRLTEGQHAKLKYLAERFEAPKTPVAQNLLNAAMDDALRILGAHDAISDEMADSIPMDEQNRIIDRQVSKYYEKIQLIFDKEHS